MKIISLGGGPAGLYFSILMKKADPKNEVRIIERNRTDETFGFGVVFSDATLENLRAADPETHDAITRSFAHWDDIDVFFKGSKLTSRGHGFSGLSRKRLLAILTARAQTLGVRIEHATEVQDVAPYLSADLVLAADGVNSRMRQAFESSFKPTVLLGKSRFVWLGTTFPFPAFTFIFKENTHGLFRVHAYRYEEKLSTFIVECTEETWKKAGLDRASEEDTKTYCEALFKEELQGHPLLINHSLWRAFPNVSCARWRHDNVVLIGDAAHTAHFSIGSGTKLALEDAISLATHLQQTGNVRSGADGYEAERQPILARTQRAADVSQAWFEDTERYMKLEPLDFSFSLLTRSLRVTHANLKLRDPEFVQEVDRNFVARAAKATNTALAPTTPPMFTPFRLRGMTLPNRIVVSPMCMYSADDGEVNDWHLVHLGSRAIGGAGLVITEMTDVNRDGRITPGCAGLYREEHVAAYRRIVDFVHTHSPSKIGVQLAHAGRKGSTRRPWEGNDQPLNEGNWPLLAPSAIPYLKNSQVPRAMDRNDMDTVRDDFVRAAHFALRANFDLIELHLAHGYLLSAFLSPLTNQRKDQYGGSLENRLRFPLEIFDAVRRVWPSDRPMSVRLSATDWMPGGFTPDEAVAVATILKAHELDILDVSAGGLVPEAKPVYGRLFQTPFAEKVRLEANLPVMTVGNISSFADVNSILAAGRADLCVLARAHLYDPYWTRHAAYEQGYEMPWPNPYKSITRYTPRHD